APTPRGGNVKERQPGTIPKTSPASTPPSPRSPTRLPPTPPTTSPGTLKPGPGRLAAQLRSVTNVAGTTSHHTHRDRTKVTGLCDTPSARGRPQTWGGRGVLWGGGPDGQGKSKFELYHDI